MITKLIHWYYAFLRAVGLREKAKFTIKNTSSGLTITIDKLDPGEEIRVFTKEDQS